MSEKEKAIVGGENKFKLRALVLVTLESSGKSPREIKITVVLGT